MASKRSTRRKRGPGLVASLRDPDKIRVAYIVAGLALVFGGSLGFGSARCNNGGSDRPPGAESEYVAEIEDRQIEWFDYLQKYEQMKARMEMQSESILHPPEWELNVRYSTLRQMLDMEYFDLRASQAGIEITDEQVNETVDEYRNTLVPQITYEEDRSILQRIGDALSSAKEDKAFEYALRTRLGITEGELRDTIYQDLLAREYVTRLTTEKTTEIMNELTIEAEGIRTRIVEGEEFADIATSRSDHMESRSAGGLVPMVKHNATNLPQRLIDDSFSMALGEISQPIPIGQSAGSTSEGLNGVWLLTVISRISASGAEWEASREALRQTILEEKRALVDSGELQMPEDGTLTVSEEEIIAAYEEATIRVIYLQAGDPMQRVSDAVRADQAGLRIVIHDPELRAMHHVMNEQWALACADFMDSLQRNADNLDTEAGNEYSISINEARIRYLIGNLWGTRAFQSEAAWMQEIWTTFQANPDSFGGEFPEVPEEIKQEQQGYFVLALMNLDRAIELEPMDPWARSQRAQLHLAREQLSTDLIGDLQFAHDYSSGDYELENTRVLSSLNQAVALDDRLLIENEDVRPETWADPMFPEYVLGLTLEQIDAPFIELIEEARTNLNPNIDDEPEVEPVVEADLSGVEEEAEVAVEESVSEALEAMGIEGEEPPVTQPEIEIELPDYIPVVGMAEPYGPYTQELRDQLDELHSLVQAAVDELTAVREAAEAERQAMMDQQIQQLELNLPEEAPEPPSEEASDLLTGGEEAGGE